MASTRGRGRSAARSGGRAAGKPAGKPLAVYHERRDFGRTPEPRGNGAGAARDGGLSYVVQKHDATRLHYDFRLEHDGVLKSWAVPKEPQLMPSARHLAVETEDHPLEYGKFEGEIPKGEYGAGSVVIWDRGTWQPEGDVARGLRDGKLSFALDGERLRGRWTLVRMARKDAKRKAPDNWLLIKRSDSERAAPRAAQSARGKARAGVKRREAPQAAARSAKTLPGARRAPLPERVAPQLATLAAAPVEAEGWLHEQKLDGYRLLIRVEQGRVRLSTRRGNDWTARFLGIAAAAAELPCTAALLDGEAVVYDARGVTSFQRLQNAIGRGDPDIVFVAFDLLYLDGYDLRQVPLRERKAALEALLDGRDAGTIRYGEHVEGNGAAFFRAACELGLEGIVSKRADDAYRETRSRNWLKIKCLARQELVVAGFTDPGGARTGFGALLLGVRDDAEAPLRYAGKVGTGFDEATLKALRARLEKLKRKTPPVDAASARRAGRSGVHWVEPELVAEVAFTEWTEDGRLRHARFLGLREDKPASEIVVERPVAASNREDTKPAKPAKSAKSAKSAKLAKPAKAAKAAKAGSTARKTSKPVERSGKTAEPDVAFERVRLTTPERLLWPDPGITKRELAEYWASVASVALPLMAERPLTLVRCPDGYASPCFYQKHVGKGMPANVPRVTVDEDEEPYAMVDGLPALLGLVQISALELHVWGSRAARLEQPDIVVFDLDPAEGLPWRAVVTAAFELRERLEGLGLVPFVRVTGGKGLHLVVPVEPGPEWPAVKHFARAVVDEMVREAPRRFTASVSKAKRTGKIFVDYLRNDRGSTAIASYSPRARPGAPVALPIAWDELDERAKAPPQFPLRDVPALVARREDPWTDFDASRRSLE